MSKLFLYFALSLLICVAGCSTNDELTANDSKCASCQKCSQAGNEVAGSGIPMTTTQAILHGKQVIGYIETCGKVSTGCKRSSFPPGTRFIQDRDFQVMGIITPKGQVWRLADGEFVEKLHQADIMKNLAVFFNVTEDKLAISDI